MKNLCLCLMAFVLFAVPAVCFAEKIDLVVFAAASMTETLTEIADLYKEAAPDIELIYTFDSSGTLKTQIQEGADCDVFISAAPKQMNQLDITASEEANPEDDSVSIEVMNLPIRLREVVLLYYFYELFQI